MAGRRVRVLEATDSSAALLPLRPFAGIDAETIPLMRT
jgi:hypothetical protein